MENFPRCLCTRKMSSSTHDSKASLFIIQNIWGGLGRSRSEDSDSGKCMLYHTLIQYTFDVALDSERRASGNKIIDPTVQPAKERHCYQHFIHYIVGQRLVNVGLVARNPKHLVQVLTWELYQKQVSVSSQFKGWANGALFDKPQNFVLCWGARTPYPRRTRAKYFCLFSVQKFFPWQPDRQARWCRLGQHFSWLRLDECFNQRMFLQRSI